jgi:hypothetical protein
VKPRGGRNLMASNDYHFITTWRVASTLDEVFGREKLDTVDTKLINRTEFLK